MHLELEHFLLRTLRSAALSSQLDCSEEERATLGRLACELESASIEDAPQHIGKFLASPVVFELAQKFSAETGARGRVRPTAVAEALVNCSQETALFRLETGNSGHINAQPTAEFVDLFFKALVGNASLRLFSRKMFVCIETSLTGAEPEDGEMGCQTAVVDWRAFLEPQTRANCEEFVHFLASCPAYDQLTEEQKLMLLALAGDDELEVRPYLEQQAGRQNVPWYVRRFLVDTSGYLQRLQVALGEQQAEFQQRYLPAGLGQLVEELLGFRNSLFAFRERKRPEKLMRKLLDIMRAFYAYYNLPQSRALLALVASDGTTRRSQDSGKQAASVLALVQLAEYTVTRGLAELGCVVRK